METKLTPEIGSCLRYGWELYKRDPLTLTGATLVGGILCVLADMVPFAGMLVAAPLLAGLYRMIMRMDRGESVAIRDLFDGFGQFLPLVIASVLVSLLVMLGMILLVLPGIYLAVSYGFTTLMIVDRKLDFWPAMENSRRLITQHFWHYGLFALAVLGIVIVASLPFGLGLLVAFPVCLAAQYHYYRALSDDETGQTAPSSTETLV